jgi:hypothetical protein
MRWVQVKQDVSKLNVHVSAWFMLMVLIYYCIVGRVYTIKNTDALGVATKGNGLEVNADKTKYMIMSRDRKAGRGHNITLDDRSFERAEQFKCLGTNLTSQDFIHEGIKHECKECLLSFGVEHFGFQFAIQKCKYCTELSFCTLFCLGVKQ